MRDSKRGLGASAPERSTTIIPFALRASELSYHSSKSRGDLPPTGSSVPDTPPIRTQPRHGVRLLSGSLRQFFPRFSSTAFEKTNSSKYLSLTVRA